MAEPFRAMKLCVMLNLAAVAAEAAGFAARARRYAAALVAVVDRACRRAAALGAVAARACRRAAGIACPYACAACLCLVVLCHRAAYAE